MSKRYLVSIRQCPDPRARLICFPFGGAGSSSFWGWRSGLPPGVELWAVCLPGRENRRAEFFVVDAQEVVQCISDEIESLPVGKYAFYGHSVGAGLAIETANHLRKSGRSLPSLLIASGRLPPHRSYEGNWSHRPDNELVNHLASLGGIPPEVLNNPQFLAAYLPKLRADFTLNESLSYSRFDAFEFPITIIGAADDPLADERLLHEWQWYTTNRFNLFTMNGDHFFIQSHFDELISIVSDELAEMCLTEEMGTR